MKSPVYLLLGAVAGATITSGAASKVVRPALKTAVRGYLAANNKLAEIRAGIAEIRAGIEEELEDVTAEIVAEGIDAQEKAKASSKKTTKSG